MFPLYSNHTVIYDGHKTFKIIGKNQTVHFTFVCVKLSHQIAHPILLFFPQSYSHLLVSFRVAGTFFYF